MNEPHRPLNERISTLTGLKAYLDEHIVSKQQLIKSDDLWEDQWFRGELAVLKLIRAKLEHLKSLE